MHAFSRCVHTEGMELTADTDYILNVQRPIVGGAETRLMYSGYACTTDVNVSTSRFKTHSGCVGMVH